MLKHTLIRAFALSLPLLLFSCKAVPFADYAFLGRFPKGESREVIVNAKNSDPIFSYSFAASGKMRATEVDIYKMQFEAARKPAFLGLLLGPKQRYDFIAFAYQDNKLVYCGVPDDFKKSSNPEVLEIGAQLNDALLKEY